MAKKVIVCILVASMIITCKIDVSIGSPAQSHKVTNFTKQDQKRQNMFSKIFKSPFKRIGKFFRSSGSNDKQKYQTLRDFEIVGSVKIVDARLNLPDFTDRYEMEDPIQQGINSLRSNNLNEAIKQLTIASSLHPRDGKVHDLLGIALNQKGLKVSAKKAHELATELEPENHHHLNNQGYSLYLSGNYKDAVKIFKKACKLAPQDNRLLNNLALAQSRLGKFDEALKSFVLANGEYVGRVNIAKMLKRLGYEKQAIFHLQSAQRFDPSPRLALEQLLDIYKQNGDTKNIESISRSLYGFSSTQNRSAVK